MPKFDFKKRYKALYTASSGKPALVDVPPRGMLMVDGEGDPNTVPEFMRAIETLYGLSYTMKFALKKADAEADHVVPPLEGLWWQEDMANFSVERKDAWKWTLMIPQPETVTEALLTEAVSTLAKKKKVLSEVRFDIFHEGLSAQVLHLGPYETEAETIRALHDFARESGYELRGRHHEIYLSDPARTDPAKLKTILRQPVAKRG